jgi:hypothetical protein
MADAGVIFSNSGGSLLTVVVLLGFGVLKPVQDATERFVI